MLNKKFKIKAEYKPDGDPSSRASNKARLTTGREVVI